jgi:hypothetical protein
MSTKITYEQILLTILPNVLPQNSSQERFDRDLHARFTYATDIAYEIELFLIFKEIAERHKLCFYHRHFNKVVENLTSARYSFKHATRDWIDLSEFFLKYDFDPKPSGLDNPDFWAEAFREFIFKNYPADSLLFMDSLEGQKVVIKVLRVYVPEPPSK